MKGGLCSLYLCSCVRKHTVPYFFAAVASRVVQAAAQFTRSCTIGSMRRQFLLSTFQTLGKWDLGTASLGWRVVGIQGSQLISFLPEVRRPKRVGSDAHDTNWKELSLYFCIVNLARNTRWPIFWMRVLRWNFALHHNLCPMQLAWLHGAAQGTARGLAAAAPQGDGGGRPGRPSQGLGAGTQVAGQLPCRGEQVILLARHWWGVYPRRLQHFWKH